MRHENKCKVISSSPNEITIDGDTVEKVNMFIYLGSVMPGISDVNRQIVLVSSTFGKLKRYGTEKIYLMLSK